MTSFFDAAAPDGTRLFVAVDGSGPPLLFLHEVAGDWSDWQEQVERLADRYTCIRYNARGYPPSDVPLGAESYGQARAFGDAVAVLDRLDVPAAHLVGLSMGGFCALHLLLEHPQRVLSAAIVGAGYGSAPHQRAGFVAEARRSAELFRTDVAGAAEAYSEGPTRLQFKEKHPHKWRAFADRLADRHPVGMSMTFAEVLGKRPSLYDLQERLSKTQTPVLLVVGDEDDGCLDVNLMLKRALPAGGLSVLPRTGHTVNLEEPEAFSATLAEFLRRVDAGTWPARDPATINRGLIGMTADTRPGQER